MIIWIKGDVFLMPCDQRCQVISVNGSELVVALCGNGKRTLVDAHDVCGVELAENLHLMFQNKTVVTKTVGPSCAAVLAAASPVEQPKQDSINAACPDDIRAANWSVAVHNDYQQDGLFHTFWLFTRAGQAVKGEGRNDAEALNEIRKQLHMPEL